MRAHLWELGSTVFTYYFITENCSYHLLSLLEIADPSLDLQSQFPMFTAPSDTVRLVANTPGLVVDTVYRPSQLSRLKQQAESFNANELSLVKALARDSDRAEKKLDYQVLQEEKKAAVVSAAIDHHRVFSEYENRSESLKNLQRLRSNLPAKKTLNQIKRYSTPPHLGHGSSRIGFGIGFDESGSFEEVRFRGAFHDLLEREISYPPNTQIEVLNARLRLENEQRRFRLEELKLINVVSLVPWSSLIRKPSWDAGFGWRRLRNSNCGELCAPFYIEAGSGLAFATSLLDRELFYFLTNFYLQTSPSLPGDFRFGPQAEVGMLVDMTTNAKLSLKALYDYSPFLSFATDYRFVADMRLSLSNTTDFRATATQFEQGTEVVAGLHWFF